MRRVVGFALFLCTGGCGLLLDGDPLWGSSTDGGQEAVDSNADALDAADTGVAPAFDCQPERTGTGRLLAQYDMEHLDEGELVDSVGAHHGTFPGSREPEVTRGPEGCGDAWQTGNRAYGLVPNDDDWDLPRGAVDLWLRRDADAAAGDIVTRDAESTMYPGHFLLSVSKQGRIFLRIQNPDADSYTCSNEPLPDGRWTHVGINFSSVAPAMFVNGRLQSGTGTVETSGERENPCDVVGAGGIEGNDNTWVFGASNGRAKESASDPSIVGHASGLALDVLRIWDAPQPFDTWTE